MARLIGTTMETYTRRLLRDVDDGSGVTCYSTQDYLDMHNAVYHWWCAKFSALPKFAAALNFTLNTGTTLAASAAPATLNRVHRGAITYNGAVVTSTRVSMSELKRLQIENPTQAQPDKWAIEGENGAYGTYVGAVHPIPDKNSSLDVYAMIPEVDIAAGTSPAVNDSECRTLCHIAAVIMAPIMGRPADYIQALAAPIPDAIKTALGLKQSLLRVDLEHYPELT